ncbi:MAG: ABC transporter permease [Coraliomargaritaceae bacterium]
MQKAQTLLARQKWFPVSIASVVLCLLLAFASPAFLSLTNFESILLQASVTLIMAVGMCLIILSGGIDISMGAILFFTSALFAKLMVETDSYFFCMGVAMVCATGLGTINGLLVNKFQLSPLITTLATYSIYRGMAIHLTGAENIPVSREHGFLGNGNVAGIPVPILLLVTVLLVGVYLLTKTRFGLYLRAMGNSSRSASESGLPVQSMTVLVYAIGGFFTGIAALILIARVGGLQSGIGIGIEFTVIAAVILGGTKLSGGSGSVVGSAMGAIFLVLIDNGLNLLNASPYIYDIVRGGVLLAAVIIDRASVYRQERQRRLEEASRL